MFRLGKAASQWHRQLSGGVGQVWELMYVAVVCEGTQTQNSKLCRQLPRVKGGQKGGQNLLYSYKSSFF